MKPDKENTFKNNFTTLCYCSAGVWVMSWDDVGDLSAAGSGCSTGRRKQFP